MARPLRIEFPGAVYYLISYGNGGQNVFLDSHDGQEWLKVFENVCKRFKWICYAYCLMGNHYELVIETPEPNLSKGMRQLNGVYTQDFNRKHGRGGHVFQGRFKAILVQKEKYLADLVKYILFSPVRAGFTKLPHQFKWSSCKHIVSKEECPNWIDTETLKEHFGDVGKEFLHSDVPDLNVLENVKGQIYLGDDEFISSIQKIIDKEKDLSEIPRIQRTNFKSIEECLKLSGSRDEAISKAYLSGNYTMKQLADHFSLHYSTISRIVKEYENLNR